MLSRRRLLHMVVASLFVRPLAATAQQADRIRRVGLLIPFAESDVEAQT